MASSASGMEATILASAPLRLPHLPRCPALGVSLRDGCLLPRPPHFGQVRSAACAQTAGTDRFSSPWPTQDPTRVRRHATGTARTRSAAAAMLPYSFLRTAGAPCAAHPGASTCALEEWGPPGSLPRVPAPPAPPFGRPTATASEPYVSACARVRWTRVARGCALSPSRLRLGVFPSSPRPSV